MCHFGEEEEEAMSSPPKFHSDSISTAPSRDTSPPAVRLSTPRSLPSGGVEQLLHEQRRNQRQLIAGCICVTITVSCVVVAVYLYLLYSNSSRKTPALEPLTATALGRESLAARSQAKALPENTTFPATPAFGKQEMITEVARV